jgi:thioredoxin reductase (NADPH)
LDVPSDVRPSSNRSRRPLPQETSVRGVFAIGDVRSGSVKRVGAAIGEGAVAVAELHALLANDGPLRRDIAGISDRTAKAKAHLSD